jgi:hypothetical protein
MRWLHSVASSPGLTVQFYGSNAATCSGGAPDPEDDALGGTTPIASAPGVWMTQCVTLQAHSEAAFLKVMSGGGSGYVFVDNIRPVGACQ